MDGVLLLASAAFALQGLLAAGAPAPTPTTVPVTPAKPTPVVRSAREEVAEIARGKSPAVARLEVYGAAKERFDDRDFLYQAFVYFANPPAQIRQEDAALSKKLARELAKEFLVRFRSAPNASIVFNWTSTYDKQAGSSEPASTPTPAVESRVAVVTDQEAELEAARVEMVRTGTADEGFRHLQRITRKYPSFADAQYWLAFAYAQRGEDDNACSAFKEYLHLAPDGKFAKTAESNRSRCSAP